MFINKMKSLNHKITFKLLKFSVNKIVLITLTLSLLMIKSVHKYIFYDYNLIF